jgi:hypothetical protein
MRDWYGCKFLTIPEPGIQHGSWRRNAILGISDIGLKLMDEADWRRSSLEIPTACIQNPPVNVLQWKKPQEISYRHQTEQT